MATAGLPVKDDNVGSDSDIRHEIERLEHKQQMGALSARDCANLCILYDRLRDTTSLKRNLKTPDCLSTDDFKVWYALGFLHRKVSLFGSAVACFERALTIEPRNVEALLGIGYCYEGLKEFDKAIASVEKALSTVTSGLAEEKYLPELYHALGHFYTGRSRYGQDRVQSLDDRDKGDQYMQLAVELDKSYTSCLAGIHCETKRYEEALDILNKAILKPEIAHDPLLYTELYFYRGDAHRGLEQYDAAIADFDYVERFATNQSDQDIAAHAKLFKVRTFLQQKSLDELTQEELKIYLSLVLEKQPSEYAILSFREERNRMVYILHGLLNLKEYLANPESQDEREKLVQVISYFAEVITPSQPLVLPIIMPGDIRLEAKFPVFVKPLVVRYYEFPEQVDSQSLAQYDVWVVVISSRGVAASDLGHVIFRIGRYVETKTIVFFDELGIMQDQQGLGAVKVDRWDDGILLATFALLNDRIKRYVAEPEVPIGLTPFATAPAPIIAQTGTLPLL